MTPPSRAFRRARRLLWPLLCVWAFLIGLSRSGPVILARAPDPMRAAFEWPVADGAGGRHHAPSGSITAANVRGLRRVWSYRTGDVAAPAPGRSGTAFEATPIMVEGTLYVATPRSRVVALDAETGSELWTFDPGIDTTDAHQSTTTSRGVSTWLDPDATRGSPCRRRIFLASYDARLFALDARTGVPCATFGERGVIDLGVGVARIAGRRADFKQTAPPTVIGHVVVVGSCIVDGNDAAAPAGIVRGFDARSGRLLWGWEPLVEIGRAQDPERATVGAANTWATIVADPGRDLLFVPTGSPSPDHYGGLRPGDNRYANSLVALRGSTGELVWHYQMVHHDLWDYDLATPPALVTLTRDGVEVPAVVQGTKMGLLFVLHRETGEPLFPVEERPVPASDVPGEVSSPTQPVPVLPRSLVRARLGPEQAWGLTALDRAACRRRLASLRHDGPYAPPSLRGTVVLPGFAGGMEWGGVGIDPDSRLLVVNVNHVAMIATLIPRTDLDTAAHRSETDLAPQRGTPYAVRREALLSPIGLPCTPPPWGTLAAVDLEDGQVRWEIPLGTVSDKSKIPAPRHWGSPNLGGPLVTGGLVFIAATMDRRLRAFDVETGTLVWEDRLPASGQATPITYRTRPGGRQLIVLAAGGHARMKSTLGDWVVAYALAEEPAAAGIRP
jgi:quinoprotein glucose dehydrogenase